MDKGKEENNERREYSGTIPEDIFVIRHGKDNDGGELTEEGREQMGDAGNKFKNIKEVNGYDNNECLILCSPWGKGKKSAEIIAEVADISIEYTELLYPDFMDNDQKVAIGNIMDLIKSKRSSVEMLIVVGHSQYLIPLIKSVLLEIGSKRIDPPIVSNGEGVRINSSLPQRPLQNL